MNQTLQEQVQMLQTHLETFIKFFETDRDFNTMVYTKWSANHVLSHIVFWHESFAMNLKNEALNLPAHPHKGKLSEVNDLSVSSFSGIDIEAKIARLRIAQTKIVQYIAYPNVILIPYKKGSRPYPPIEHIEVVSSHINRHLSDLRKTFNSK